MVVANDNQFSLETGELGKTKILNRSQKNIPFVIKDNNIPKSIKSVGHSIHGPKTEDLRFALSNICKNPILRYLYTLRNS